MIKRFFDIVFSSLALLILAPVLVPVIIILRFSGEGEVFYRQERLGFKNKPENFVLPNGEPNIASTLSKKSNVFK